MSSAPSPVVSVVQQAIDSLGDKPGALLPMLHAIQDALGYIPSEALPMLAEALNQTRAEISGVVSFYHHFRTSPPGAQVLEVCRAEACQARGSRQLEAYIKQRLGIGYHQTSADQQLTLEPVYCLGNCACGPSLRVGDEIHGRVSAERFEHLLESMGSQVVEVAG